MPLRSVPKALAMGAIPFAHIYLFYCLCKEAKVAWGEAALNPTLMTILFLFPVLQAYPAFKLTSTVERNLTAAGKKAYAIPARYLSLLFLVPVALAPTVVLAIPGLVLAYAAWLYIVYATQSRFNECGVSALG